MEVYNNLSELPVFNNAVITIGSFDGVHHGHQQILGKIGALAKEIGGESIVITFHPHPRLVLQPDLTSLRLITTIDEKVALFEKYGVDNVVVVPFTLDFANQSADEYIQEFLIAKFQPRYIVIGYDHHFGKNRVGDIDYLRRYQESGGFEIVEIEPQAIEDIAVSSTKIRKALEHGDVKTAAHLLEHNYSLNGTVIHGQGIGNTLGYPTANLAVKSPHKLIPPSGIYAVRVLHQEKTYDAVLYIGHRPTLEEFTNRTIEVHLFDFDKDIYGDKLRLEFIDFIRGDARFEGMDALKIQMDKDAAKARSILKKTPLSESLEKKKAKPLVAVVILNYNGRKWLEKFIPPLLASTYSNLRLIVADNKSTDDSLDYLAQQFPTIEILALSENHGFAKGYNEALKQIEAPYYVLLNSDVEVSPGWIEPIIERMEEDLSIGVCQPKILTYHRRDYFEYAGAAGGWMDHLGYPFSRGRLFDTVEKDTGQYDDEAEIFWASGAALFIRGALFQQIGGLDSDYYAHHEEIDLCWRLKRAGFKIMVIPSSVVYHVGGGTLDYENPRKTYLNFRNSLYSIVKNEAAGRRFRLILIRLILDGLAAGMFLVKGKWSHIKAILKAHFSFYGQYRYLKGQKKYYDDLIQKVSIGEMRKAGIYSGSIVWQYYLKGKKHFRDL